MTAVQTGLVALYQFMDLIKTAIALILFPEPYRKRRKECDGNEGIPEEKKY